MAHIELYIIGEKVLTREILILMIPDLAESVFRVQLTPSQPHTSRGQLVPTQLHAPRAMYLLPLRTNPSNLTHNAPTHAA